VAPNKPERYGVVTPDVKARPLRADAARNRARVLDAAHECVALKGVTVSTEEIARCAGVGVGTVFRHFPTKESLLEAVFADRLRRFAAEADELAGHREPHTALFAVLRRAVDTYATKHAIADALSAAGVDGGAVTGQARGILRHVLGDLLTAAQNAGTVRGDVTVDDVLALLVGTVRAAEHAGGSPERLLSVIVDGLRT
jgi:AcrR family transcriptional regulator